MTQPVNPRTARRVGATVVVLLAVVVAGLQFARGRNHTERTLDQAFAELARAELAGGKPRQLHIASAHERFA